MSSYCIGLPESRLQKPSCVILPREILIVFHFEHDTKSILHSVGRMQSFVCIIAGSTHCLIKLCFEELKILHTKCNEWELEKSRESNTGGRDNPGGDRGLVRR